MELINRVKPILSLFNKYGEAYLVGGTVRDLLLGVDPNDIDITTSIQPSIILKILQEIGLTGSYINKDTDDTKGTVGVRFIDKNIEISTFKKDPYYIKSNLKNDLILRDFTINSMALDINGKLFDYYGGMRDLQLKIIRATQSAQKRFSEDPLRMLRAVRFASTLNFLIDNRTENIIRYYAHSIINVPMERCLTELTKILLSNNPNFLDILMDTRLLGYLLPEVFPITMFQHTESKDLWLHTKMVVNNIKSRPHLKWSALLHDIGKPQSISDSNGEIHFFQHEYLSSSMADNVLKRLKASNSLRDKVKGLVLLHHKLDNVVSRRNDPPVSIRALKRLVKKCDQHKCDIEDLIELFSVDSTSSKYLVRDRQKAHASLLREALIKLDEEELKPKLPKGIGLEIMEYFNLKPGKEVGEIREKLEEMLLDGKITSDMSPKQMVKVLK